MKEFNRTLIGREFYEKQLPSLISTLQKIAKQMEIQNIREEKKFKLEERLMKTKIRNINESKEQK